MPAGATPGEPERRSGPAPVDFAGLRRPVGRAVRAAQRRLAPAREPLLAAGDQLRGVVDRRLMSLSTVGAAPGSHDDLAATLGRLPTPPVDDRTLTLVVVGSAETVAAHRSTRPAARRVDVVGVDPTGADVPAEVRRAIDDTGAELVAIVLDTSMPLDDRWLDRLAAVVVDDVAAAAPVLVHPFRTRANATPHDGRVRAAGLAIAMAPDGVPEVTAIGAGAERDPRAAAVMEVGAGPAACIVVDRAAYDRVGGLPAAEDLDVAVVELCARLRAGGGRIVVVPGAMVVDDRPVRSRRELLRPIDSRTLAWRDAIDRSGPALARAARPEPGDALRFAVTVAAPSAKVAHRWGDWHLAEGLAGGLRRLGHEVRLQTADQADHPAGRACDVHLVLRGLQPVRRTAGQRHLLWIISHPEAITDDELDAADLVLVASVPFAEHLRHRTSTPVEVLLQATDQHRFFPRASDPAFAHPVTVVAKTRGVLRPIVADAIAAGIRPAIYGGGWRELVDPTLVVADHLDNEMVPVVYSSAGVVLNDHWDSMRTWGFVSNRIFDVLACGAPLISDAVPGLAELFDGAVHQYRTPAELRALVDGVLADPDAARGRAGAGRAIVVARHTFDHRAGEVLRALVRNG